MRASESVFAEQDAIKCEVGVLRQLVKSGSGSCDTQERQEGREREKAVDVGVGQVRVLELSEDQIAGQEQEPRPDEKTGQGEEDAKLAGSDFSSEIINSSLSPKPMSASLPIPRPSCSRLIINIFLL